MRALQDALSNIIDVLVEKFPKTLGTQHFTCRLRDRLGRRKGGHGGGVELKRRNVFRVVATDVVGIVLLTDVAVLEVELASSGSRSLRV